MKERKKGGPTIDSRLELSGASSAGLVQVIYCIYRHKGTNI